MEISKEQEENIRKICRKRFREGKNIEETEDRIVEDLYGYLFGYLPYNPLIKPLTSA